MNNLLQLFLLKMVDTMIGSGKTIFMIRGQKFLSAASQALSNVFYVILMSKLMKSTDPASIAVTSLAMFIGQYISQWIADKFNKVKVFKISATAKTRELGEVVIDALGERDLNFRVLKAEGKHSKAYALDIFCHTKEETKVAKEVLSNYNLKFYTVELKAVND
ncbi:MAG: hypothetical protein RR744_09365 [Cellulosilyticaceae bacterium]